MIPEAEPEFTIKCPSPAGSLGEGRAAVHDVGLLLLKIMPYQPL